MPAFATLTDAEISGSDPLPAHAAAARRLGPGAREGHARPAAASLEGLVLNQSAHDMQLLGDDRKLHLLRKNGDALSRR